MKRELVPHGHTERSRLSRAADYVSSRLNDRRRALVLFLIAMLIAPPTLLSLGEEGSVTCVLLLAACVTLVLSCLFLGGIFTSRRDVELSDIKRIRNFVRGKPVPGEKTPPIAHFTSKGNLLVGGTKWRIVLLDQYVLVVQDNRHITLLHPEYFDVLLPESGISSRSRTRVTIQLGNVTERANMASEFLEQYQLWRNRPAQEGRQAHVSQVGDLPEKKYGGIGRPEFLMYGGAMFCAYLVVSFLFATTSADATFLGLITFVFWLLMVPLASSRAQNMGFARSLGWLMLLPLLNVLLVAGCCIREEGYADRQPGSQPASGSTSSTHGRMVR